MRIEKNMEKGESFNILKNSATGSFLINNQQINKLT